MFRHPIVKPAFHLSWFLLILGGVSLFEKPGWGIIGAIMFITGMAILAFTSFALFLKKQFLKEPGWLLILSVGLIAVLVFAQVVFERYALAAVIAILALPVIMGWTKMRGGAPVKKSATKKKSKG